jgi:hypothetical protein
MRIFFVALIFRLVPVLVMRNMGIGLDDMFQYDMLARSIASGNGYRWYAQTDLPTVLPYLKLDLNSVEYDPRGVLTSFRPPLYPAFLAVIYLLFGMGANRYFTARLFQAILSACLAPLTYALAQKLVPARSETSLLGAERRGKIAAWIVAVYPLLVIYPLSIATENLFFVLVLSSSLILIKAGEAVKNDSASWKKVIWMVSAGISLGLTCLTRSVAGILAALAVFWVWYFLKERIFALVLLSVIGLVIAPWIVRNSILYHRLTGIETALGYDLYVGYYPTGTGTFEYPQSLKLMTIVNDSQREKIGIDQALGFIKEDPARVPYLIVRRAGYFFGLERRALTYFYSNNYFGFVPEPLLIICAIIFCVPFMLVSLSGVIGLNFIKWNPGASLLALLFIGYISPHLLIIAEDRFHLTLVPFLAILAAFFWTRRWRALTYRWQTKMGKVIIVLSLCVVSLLIANWGFELLRDADKLQLLLGANGNQTYFSY